MTKKNATDDDKTKTTCRGKEGLIDDTERSREKQREARRRGGGGGGGEGGGGGGGGGRGDETVARLLVDHTGSCPYHHVEDKGLERLVSPLGEGYEESAEQNDPDAMDEP
ncbi:hypothetical protein CSUB01_11398 [Colletotrichum sublineola]|uniref:Uncharacterized protein n=1 Tax=Colletotrichum sublineola TaxID=1173701 RepID=A0A066XKR6_COLSU|nr:hypothetical protein CSUB01_11398 [Colletotrichum sublineola]